MRIQAPVQSRGAFDVDDDSGIYLRQTYESEHVYHI